jgi:murein DD-endopeptidase MepM/ murein hydrolase activator NlpD
MKKLRAVVAAIISIVTILAGEETLLSSSGVSIELRYRAPAPGEVILVVIRDIGGIERADVSFLNKICTLGPLGNSQKSIAFVGLDLNLAPGKYPLIISFKRKGRPPEEIRKEILVASKEFPAKKLRVKPDYVTPPPDVQERIARESRLLEEVYGLPSPRWLGGGNFVIPNPGRASPNFGERRIYNNTPRSSHSGIDISAPMGSRVRASNSGKVVLASDLYFSGKTVIIDHGLGVFSYYCHLSKFSAKREDTVNRGDVVGLVGSTGRSTGPHLHWGFRVSGCRVDPFSILGLPLE